MNINITQSIQISADSKKVFTYFSNPAKDKFWRKEINNTTINSEPKLGAIAREDSFLSKKVPNHILELECVEFSNNKEIVYQTVPGSRFFLRSRRRVEEASGGNTIVTYQIEFSKDIVKHGIGFSLPTFLINMVTNKDMKKYLHELKRILETENS